MFIGQIVEIVSDQVPIYIANAFPGKQVQYLTMFSSGERVWGADRHLAPLADPDEAEGEEKEEELDA